MLAVVGLDISCSIRYLVKDAASSNDPYIMPKSVKETVLAPSNNINSTNRLQNAAPISPPLIAEVPAAIPPETNPQLQQKKSILQ